jgi:tetratricopeptide (TPR) repeat protein
MSVEEATRIVKDALVRFRWSGFPSPLSYWKPDSVKIDKVAKTDQVVATAYNGKDSAIWFNIATLKPKLVNDKKNGYDWELHPTALDGIFGGGKGDQAALRSLADALLVLKLRSSIEFDPTFQRRFDEAVRASRLAPAGSDISEAARRFRVQAELAFQKKDIPGAAGLYEQGLKVEPGWAAGHYNRAEMLAAMERYTEALIAMHRYLTLRPDAADARAALDRTYEWESEDEWCTGQDAKVDGAFKRLFQKQKPTSP